MNLNLYDNGLFQFIELCNKNVITESDIDELLNNKSYNKTIELMGLNWGIGLFDDWKKIFKAAFLNNKEDLNKIQSLCVNHIIKAKNDYKKLISLSNRIIEVINSKEFINIAKEYATKRYRSNLINWGMLPFIISDEELPFDRDDYIFIPNAGGNQAIIMDAFFLEPFEDEEITRILAHELHHIIRSKHEVEYKVELNFDEILQMAYWFESEGTANLCNFEETNKLYEMFGYIEKGSTIHFLNNIDVLMNDINNLIADIYENQKSGKELYQYLFDNLKFHAIGYHMALTIFKFSQFALKSSVGDPLKFINLYQTVCELSEYKFTEKSIKIINQILTIS